MDNSDKLEGKCRDCPKILLVREDGRMRLHFRGSRKGPECHGSGDMPEWTRPYVRSKRRVKIKD